MLARTCLTRLQIYMRPRTDVNLFVILLFLPLNHISAFKKVFFFFCVCFRKQVDASSCYKIYDDNKNVNKSQPLAAFDSPPFHLRIDRSRRYESSYPIRRFECIA